MTGDENLAPKPLNQSPLVNRSRKKGANGNSESESPTVKRSHKKGANGTPSKNTPYGNHQSPTVKRSQKGTPNKVSF